MISSVPAIADVVDATTRPGVLTFKYSSAKSAYSREALTSCGHHHVVLRVLKSDENWHIEDHGQRVHCSVCDALQSFGPAAPGRRQRGVAPGYRAAQFLRGMSSLSDHDDEPYGGGV